MAYPKVHIVNSTNYTVKGTVKYAACSSDDFEIAPWGNWTAGSRGVCLLTKITANVYTPGKTEEADSYSSSGTSYSQFAILKKTDGFTVTRIVT